MIKREDMTLNQLMGYYLEGCQVANGGSATGCPGDSCTVFAETSGGEGFADKPIKARAWGEFKSEPVVLMKLAMATETDKPYALSYETYKEVCSLLSRDLSDCPVAEGTALSGAAPGGCVYVNIPGKPTISAVAWYEVPAGKVKLFQVDGKQYVISPVASKKTRISQITSHRTGSFENPDLRREVIWHKLDLSKGEVAESGFPRKPEYLL